jgi:DNA-binding response OmpR family regulator
MARILIVEDESHLATGIKFNLEMEGYEAVVVGDGPAALALLVPPFPGGSFDLVVLDVMLPGLDGFAVAEAARKGGNRTPILMLTAKGLPTDVVQGLEAGADDYLPKPFDLGVLLARIKGLLRRLEWAKDETEEPELVQIGQAKVDFRNLEVRVEEQTYHLTLLETMLLKLLVHNAGQVVSKGEILKKVWNLSPETETRAIDNFIVRLRRYLEPNPRFPRYLHTVRGAGYRLVLEDEVPPLTGGTKTSSSSSASGASNGT